MYSQIVLALAAAIAGAEASAVKGFNYGSTDTNNNPLGQSQFEALMNRAQNLPGTTPFNSARLYTMIQGGSTNSPIEAIPAAISTKTTLLLGMWASGGDGDFANELAALKSAISQYGSQMAGLVTGLSVGSEDLYRDSVTGIANKDGVGVGPDVIVSYIQQVRSAIAGTPLSHIAVGHVDTWDAWVNGSNSAVIQNVDWLGVDSYPYFETSVPNAIGSQANTAFFNSVDATKGVSGGKPVWVTETGWPVSGPNSGSAVASVQNAETYWQDVGCSILGSVNTWWYTLEDAMPTTPSPSFGIIGSDLSSAPLYDLTCKKKPSTSSGGSSTTTGKGGSGSKTSPSSSTSTGKSGHSSGSHSGSGSSSTTSSSGSSGSSSSSSSSSGGSGSSSGTPSASSSSSAVSSSPSSSTTTNAASQAGSAMGACILAIFGLIAIL